MEKKHRQSFLIGAAIFLLLILVLVAGKIIGKYSPSKDRQDLTEYYGLTDASSAAIVLDHEIISQKAVIKNKTAYLDYETVKDLLNGRFYWDENENLLLYTTASDVVSAPVSGKDYYVTKEKKTEDYVIVYADSKTSYIALDYIQKFTDLDFHFYENPNRIVVTTDWSDFTAVPVKKDTQIRYKGGIKSPILSDVKKEDSLILLEEGENWDKVATKDGVIGYARSKRLGKKETKSHGRKPRKEEFPHIFKEGKINMGWHQVTVQEANQTVTDVLSSAKGLNVISPTWFYLNDDEGNLMNLASAEYVQYCHSQGVDVWALVSNLENEDVDSAEVLNHTSRRTNMVNQLIAAAIQYNFDGINVDFEALSEDAGDGYLQFIRELSIKCKNNGIILSVDNYVPMDHNAFYNRKEQANFADYVVIMGYDEHWAGSGEGSVASIGFVTQGIEDTLKEVPENQVILGAPFFTRVWMETPKEADNDMEAAKEDYVPYDLTSSAVNMQEAWNMAKVNGAEPAWSDADGQYYTEYEKDGVTYKIWLEDEASMELRLSAAQKANLAGMAFWKLGLEDPGIWNTIIKYMN